MSELERGLRWVLSDFFSRLAKIVTMIEILCVWNDGWEQYSFTAGWEMAKNLTDNWNSAPCPEFLEVPQHLFMFYETKSFYFQYSVGFVFISDIDNWNNTKTIKVSIALFIYISTAPLRCSCASLHWSALLFRVVFKSVQFSITISKKRKNNFLPQSFASVVFQFPVAIHVSTALHKLRQ